MLLLQGILATVCLRTQASEPPQEESDFSITLSVSKKTCYVREEVELELEIKSGLTSIDIGFSRYDLNLPGTFLEEVLPVEKGQGRAVIRRRIVPLSSGTYRLGPAKIFSTVLMPGSSVEGLAKRATLVSNELAILVLPLPKDEDANGLACAVGDYEFSVNPNKTTAQIGEPVLIEYEISGRGSMRTFPLPHLDGNERFFAGGIRDQKLTVDRTTRIKKMVYTQELIALSADLSEIPAIEFVYFDLATEKYVSRKNGPFALDVKTSTRFEESPEENNLRGGLQHEARYPAEMSGIKRGLGSIRSETVRTIYTRVFWYIQTIPLAVIVLSGAYVTYRRQMESAELRNFARAHKRAMKELKRARRFLKSGDVETCFTMLPKIIRQYVGDKLNISAGGMTNHEIVRYISRYTHRKRFLRMVDALLGIINQSHYTQEELDPKRVRKWLKTTEKVIHWMEWHRIFRSMEKEYRRALSEEVV
jgi:hypothetical protein